MSTVGISLPDLKAFKASKGTRLALPPDLVSTFRQQTRIDRKAVMRFIVWPTALVDNAVLRPGTGPLATKFIGASPMAAVCSLTPLGNRPHARISG